VVNCTRVLARSASRFDARSTCVAHSMYVLCYATPAFLRSGAIRVRARAAGEAAAPEWRGRAVVSKSHGPRALAARLQLGRRRQVSSASAAAAASESAETVACSTARGPKSAFACSADRLLLSFVVVCSFFQHVPARLRRRRQHGRSGPAFHVFQLLAMAAGARGPLSTSGVSSLSPRCGWLVCACVRLSAACLMPRSALALRVGSLLLLSLCVCRSRSTRDRTRWAATACRRSMTRACTRAWRRSCAGQVRLLCFVSALLLCAVGGGVCACFKP
jgi:hypothetical protein